MHNEEDIYGIHDCYVEMYKPTGNKIVKEGIEDGEFPDLEDDIIGNPPDEDSDMMGDALEAKVYSHFNENFGDEFRNKCEGAKEKFDLTDDEFCMFFKGWFDKEHAMKHINDEI